jgi:hypothetical protein
MTFYASVSASLSFFFVVMHFPVARCQPGLYKWDIASGELANHGRPDNDQHRHHCLLARF